MTPLAGIRVLDFSKVLAGPLCAQWLGDLGAEVTKIEPPNSGDDTRGWPPFRGGVGAVFLSANRNKESLALDLKTEAARAAARRMVAQADVLMVNTCGFIEAARAESFGAIDEMLELKRRGDLRGVVDTHGAVEPAALVVLIDE